MTDLETELGRCNREVLGSVLGGVAGGVIGSQVGKGDTRTVTTIGGTILGVLIGGSIGRSMDRVDQACVGQVLEQAPHLHTVEWVNPDGGQYRVTPLRTYDGPQGRQCREYHTYATIQGRTQEIYGTACRQPDGTWRRVGWSRASFRTDHLNSRSAGAQITLHVCLRRDLRSSKGVPCVVI